MQQAEAFKTEVHKELSKDIQGAQADLVNGIGITNYAEYQACRGKLEGLLTAVELLQQAWAKFAKKQLGD